MLLVVFPLACVDGIGSGALAKAFSVVILELTIIDFTIMHFFVPMAVS